MISRSYMEASPGSVDRGLFDQIMIPWGGAR